MKTKQDKRLLPAHKKGKRLTSKNKMLDFVQALLDMFRKGGGHLVPQCNHGPCYCSPVEYLNLNSPRWCTRSVDATREIILSIEMFYQNDAHLNLCGESYETRFPHKKLFFFLDAAHKGMKRMEWIECRVKQCTKIKTINHHILLVWALLKIPSTLQWYDTTWTAWLRDFMAKNNTVFCCICTRTALSLSLSVSLSLCLSVSLFLSLTHPLQGMHQLAKSEVHLTQIHGCRMQMVIPEERGNPMQLMQPFQRYICMTPNQRSKIQKDP